MVDGKSNFTGFKIKDSWRKITVKSEKYIEKCLRYLFSFYLILVILTALFSLIISEVVALGIMVAVCFFIWIVNETKEWHAAEHMLMNILNNNKKLNLENLKKSPMRLRHKFCGSENRRLKKPSNRKLRKTLRVGLEYLKKKEEISKPRKIITKIKHNEASPDASLFYLPR